MNQIYRNSVLRAMSSESIERLGLQEMQVQAAHELLSTGTCAASVLFLEQGLASTTLRFADQRQVEAGIIGRTSVVGADALAGHPRLGLYTSMQVGGYGYFASIDVARKEYERKGDFHKLICHCARAEIAERSQLAACNALHRYRQRLARWLLMCVDRSQSVIFELSQESLGVVLGASRPQISIAASALKEFGFLDYCRGTVHVRDRRGLESEACECYGRVREINGLLHATLDRSLEGVAVGQR